MSFEINLVDTEEWGCQPADLRAVLRSAADQFLPHTKVDCAKNDVVVYPCDDVPKILGERDSKGRLRIELTARERYWSRYAFEFAHEIAHMAAATPSGCSWLEESLCDAAAIFTLRAMAKRWVLNPPYPNWRAYSATLAEHAQGEITDGDRIISCCLGGGGDFRRWLDTQQERFDAAGRVEHRNLRYQYRAIAVRLLPVFEADPSRWSVLATLNAAEPRAVLDSLIAKGV